MENTNIVQLPESESRTVFLIEAETSFERGTIEKWIADQPRFSGNNFQTIYIDHNRQPAGARALESLLAGKGDNTVEPWLVPLRLIWKTSQANSNPSLIRSLFSSIFDKPGSVRQRLISRTSSSSVQVVEGKGAFLSDVKQRFQQTWGAEGVRENRLPEFIQRQALITLDRAERKVRGARYKIARLLMQDVMSSPSFQRDLGGIAGKLGQSLSEAEIESKEYLEEMSARQSTFALDMMLGLQRRACQSAHDSKIDFRPEDLVRLQEWSEEAPVVLLVTHKSMLDTMVVSTTLFDNNIPVPLAFGGINLNTIGLGKLAANSGVIFLRRAFQDNEIYKATFRRYVDYLIEKRFSLMWALEGTRSRTGKLLPPRYGLMNYVVESILRTKVHNLRFVPVSISYDQITEVDDYVIEQRGQDKKPEGAGWLWRFLNGKGSKNKIYLRIGEPLQATDLMAAEKLNESLPDDEKKKLVQQIGLQAANRLNEATPINLTALLTLILLANGPRARTLEGLTKTVQGWMELVERRNIPVVGSSSIYTSEEVTTTLVALEEHGVVTHHDSVLGAVYRIGSGQYHKAAYYRNTVVHFFVTDAIIELSLLHAMGQIDSELAFWREALALRDLLKFEFYFPTREDFLKEVREKLAERDPNWQEFLSEGEAKTRSLLGPGMPLVAQGVLRSFIDAYQVVGDTLVQRGTAPVTDKKEFLRHCLEVGTQAQLLQRIFSEESLSLPLYDTVYKLAGHINLLSDENEDLIDDRIAFADQVRSVNRRLDILLGLSVSRQTD
ncbi:MAG: 1-acyl-sn-glycerol-3-phosphate acyltransferase [Parvibaculaceae bacterium]|nr:1-acyl-sn-glycerol-3-phosphate acyltransferase [Parvibaculaceae bacterium]